MNSPRTLYTSGYVFESISYYVFRDIYVKKEDPSRMWTAHPMDWGFPLKRKQAEVSPFVSFCLLIVVTFKATSGSPSHQYSSPLWWKLPFLFSDLQTAPGSPWDVCLLTVLCSPFFFLIFQRFGFTALSLSSGMNGPQVPSQSPRAVPRAQEMFCP